MAMQKDLPFPGKPWIIKPLVPDEYYTDRTEFLDYFYKAAFDARPPRRTMSTVLLGQRRMGKTEIFRRVVNRLFFEQDPQDPNTVVPVYYLFSEHETDRYLFARRYLENFMRYYIAFYLQRPAIIWDQLSEAALIAVYEEAKTVHPDPPSLERILYWYDTLLTGEMTDPAHVVVSIPRQVSDIADSTIVVFLDEFQNAALPQNEFSVVGSMQNAVESNTCPHFVTGSAMSILAREILGRGALFGRFHSKPIEPLSNYWGAELVRKVASHQRVTVSELMAPVVAERCGGNPFYITAVVQQSAETDVPLLDEEAINRVLAIDISSGFIWAELYEQVNGWINRINQQGITKWILYLSVLEENERISLERVQQELKAKESKNIPLEEIREVLIRLSRGDLLDYKEFGNWFGKVADPILIEFIKVWGRVELEGQRRSDIHEEILSRYSNLQQRIHEYKRYLAEVFMSQVLFSSQDRQKQPLPGNYFNSSDDIEFIPPLIYVRRRVRLEAGPGKEIDLLAAIGTEKWVCQSKWVTTSPVGSSVLQELMVQAQIVQTEFPTSRIRMWLFAHQGLTKEAATLAQQAGILWSNREQFDNLLTYLDLRTLPELET